MHHSPIRSHEDTNDHAGDTPSSEPPQSEPESGSVTLGNVDIDPRSADNANSPPDPSNTSREHPYTYPNRSFWLPWIVEAVRELDNMSDAPEWKVCITEWLLLEHRLGYPVGMVGDYIHRYDDWC